MRIGFFGRTNSLVNLMDYLITDTGRSTKHHVESERSRLHRHNPTRSSAHPFPSGVEEWFGDERRVTQLTQDFDLNVLTGRDEIGWEKSDCD